MVATWNSDKELRQYSIDAEAARETKSMSLRTIHGFPIKRRPQMREISDTSEVKIDKWFLKSEITIEVIADTPSRQTAARRLLYI